MKNRLNKGILKLTIGVFAIGSINNSIAGFTLKASSDSSTIRELKIKSSEAESNQAIEGPTQVKNNSYYDASTFKYVMKSITEYKDKGGSYSLSQYGSNIISGSFGAARNGVDGSLKYKTYTPGNIGSTQKINTILLFLSLVEEEGLAKTEGKSLYQYLKTKKLLDFMPQKFKDFADSSINKITLLDLMRHKSGFRSVSFLNEKGYPPINDLANYQQILENGVKDEFYNVEEYHNSNIGIFRYIVLNIVEPGIWQDFEDGYGALPIDEYTKYWDSLTILHFRKIMKERLFSKAHSPIYADCKFQFLANDPAFAYTGYMDSEAGDLIDAGCYGAGGWYYSTEDVDSIMRTLMSSEDIISNEAKELIFNNPDGHLESIALKDSSFQPWSKRLVGHDHVFWHKGGDWESSNRQANAVTLATGSGFSMNFQTNSTQAEGDFSIVNKLLESFRSGLYRDRNKGYCVPKIIAPKGQGMLKVLKDGKAYNHAQKESNMGNVIFGYHYNQSKIEVYKGSSSYVRALITKKPEDKHLRKKFTVKVWADLNDDKIFSDSELVNSQIKTIDAGILKDNAHFYPVFPKEFQRDKMRVRVIVVPGEENVDACPQMDVGNNLYSGTVLDFDLKGIELSND